MKKSISVVSVFYLLLCGTAFAQKPASRADAEKAIRAAVEQMVKGWNTKSGEEFSKPFAEDSDYVVVNGRHIKGRAVNAAAHQQIFDTIYKNHNIAADVEQVRFLRSDVALVHVLVERFPKTNRSQVVKGRLTLVMVKNNRKWEIAAFQNTQIQAENY